MIKIFAEGDYHCGHLLGLTPPDWWSNQNRALAKPVWEFRESLLKDIGKVDIHVMNGDLTDGPGKKETIGLLTTDVKEQADMAAIAAEHVKAAHRYITYGTPFHTVSSLNHEQLVADHLGIHPFETLRFRAGGQKFNVRHIVGRSDIPYGQGTQVAKEIVRDCLQSILDGFEAADIFIRSHVHYYYRVDDGRRQVLTLPAWELPNPDTDGNVFARKLRTMYYHVGAVLILVGAGEPVIHKYLMPLKYAIKREYLDPLAV